MNSKAKTEHKRNILIVSTSILFTLIVHHFLISKININSTFHIVIDFVIFWSIIFLICLPKAIKRKSKKKVKLDREDYIIFLMMIPTLIIHYFLISRIEINSTVQVVIDFVVFFFLGIIFIFIEEIRKELKKKTK